MEIVLGKCDIDCRNWVCFIANLDSQCVLYRHLMNWYSVHLPSPRGPRRIWAFPTAHCCICENKRWTHPACSSCPQIWQLIGFPIKVLFAWGLLGELLSRKRINNTDMVINVTAINCSSCLRMEQKAICSNGGFHWILGRTRQMVFRHCDGLPKEAARSIFGDFSDWTK